jgi:hypothetical protein
MHDEDLDLQRSGVATVSECKEPLQRVLGATEEAMEN